ncbi:addiction module protein [Alloalcanivorax profundimaris]|uniref:addiction module protein n=1 Tax=Alloalcanivorax profundimaris TaxID=2735259 RepID=UPI001891C117|nr:addiction module protein [Alloalcanivorax profundimaris]
MSSTKDIINQELDDLWAEEAEARLDAYECGDLEARVMSYPRNRDDAPPMFRWKARGAHEVAIVDYH